MNSTSHQIEINLHRFWFHVNLFTYSYAQQKLRQKLTRKTKTYLSEFRGECPQVRDHSSCNQDVPRQVGKSDAELMGGLAPTVLFTPQTLNKLGGSA